MSNFSRTIIFSNVINAPWSSVSRAPSQPIGSLNWNAQQQPAILIEQVFIPLDSVATTTEQQKPLALADEILNQANDEKDIDADDFDTPSASKNEAQQH